MDRLQLIARLRSAIEETLRPLLAGCSRVALVDFPNHTNVGDSAIWLGELSVLRAFGVPEPCYTCDVDTYDEAQLRRRLRDGTILIHGGGNLGDLWQEHHRFRERILTDFPDHRVIQLPQSIHFRNADSLARARAVLDAHPNLTVLVREQQSLDIARNEFRAPSYLCPDLALHLGPLARPAPPSLPLLWLAREDLERGSERPPREVESVVIDWLSEPTTTRKRWNRWLSRRPWRARMLRGTLSATYEPLARERVQRGCALLSRGRVVVCDRLHAHILCLLLGIPHILLDNNYGKLAAFHRTWTKDSELTRFADNAQHALALANGAIGEAATTQV